jgi:hypothetical protein
MWKEKKTTGLKNKGSSTHGWICMHSIKEKW